MVPSVCRPPFAKEPRRMGHPLCGLPSEGWATRHSNSLGGITWIGGPLLCGTSDAQCYSMIISLLESTQSDRQATDQTKQAQNTPTQQQSSQKTSQDHWVNPTGGAVRGCDAGGCGQL